MKSKKATAAKKPATVLQSLINEASHRPATTRRSRSTKAQRRAWRLARKARKAAAAAVMTDTPASDARFLGVTEHELTTGGRPWVPTTTDGDDPLVTCARSIVDLKAQLQAAQQRLIALLG